MSTNSVDRSPCSADLWNPRLNDTRMSDATFKRPDVY